MSAASIAWALKPATSVEIRARQGPRILGRIVFCDPFGRVLGEASHDQEEILLGEVDLKHLEDVRRNWPFLRDRRIDSYAPITSRMIDGK